MKFYSRLLSLSLLGLFVSGCNEERELVMSQDKSSDRINEMILSFYNQLHDNSRSEEHTFNIKGIFTETFKVSDSNKTRSSEQTQSFDIHTVNLDFEGTPGYAILSDTPGIEKIFYYTEEGCIGDTATIAPLKEMVETFPAIAEDILMGTTLETQSETPNYPNIDKIVPFQWTQLKPFNNYATYCTCSTCSNYKWGNHKPLGCVALALGLAIATTQKFTGTFYGNREIDFDSLPIDEYSGSHDQILQVAHFLQEIALNCQTKFGCDGSHTRLEAAYNYLKDLGYQPLLHDGALNEIRYINNLKLGFPHIVGGHNGKKGHVWILDGYMNNASGRHYHINWGWGPERSDGWSVGIYFRTYSPLFGEEEFVEYKEKLQQLYLN